MSDLMDMLQQALGTEGLNKLGEKIGADQQETSSAVAAALPALIGGLSRKGASEQEASGLMQLLDRDGDGSVIDDVQGFLGGAKADTGGDILQQILGGKQERVQQGVSKASGLDTGATQKLLGMLAPMVLGALVKQKQSDGMDVGKLMGFLGNEKVSVEQETGGMIGKLLDQDGDGDFDLSDVAKVAVGKLFGNG